MEFQIMEKHILIALKQIQNAEEENLKLSL